MNPRVLITALMLTAVTMIAACKDDPAGPGITPTPPPPPPPPTSCDVEWTSDWEGVWRFVTQGQLCESDSVYATEQVDHAICAGMKVSEFFDTEPCEITLTSTVVTINSEETFEDPELGCTITEKTTATITRNGNTLEGTFEYRASATGCDYEYAYCVRVPFDGTRIGATNGECGELEAMHQSLSETARAARRSARQ